MAQPGAGGTKPAVRTLLPDDPPGLLTVGGRVSGRTSSAVLDSITGLWTTPRHETFLFLDSLYDYEDNGQLLSANGLALRQQLPGRDVIIGANVFWDAIGSERGNDFNQLGLGVEVLTRWVDARFNCYLPEEKRFEAAHRTGPDRGASGPSRTRFTKRYEASLEGCEMELGFLLPGVERYAEVRVFGGYFRYDNPFGSPFEGFQARLEARVLPGVIADFEYLGDPRLTGGHWAAGIRVSVPLSLYNLVTFRNPFEGGAEYFRPRPRQFSERMAEMIVRTPRLETVTSDEVRNR